ncbi:MAG TPA: 50S ribosomal protein L3 [Candidatus Saccharimonadales bacterium]|nr:50S ribosomal protein L3 [Candidatus Saccharimonadales bacterium]
MKALITRKIGMTSVIGDDGALSAVTLLSATPNVITQIKDTEKDGYQALQVGFEEVKKEKAGKALAGHLKAAGTFPKIIREFRVNGDLDENIRIGEKLSADLFEVGDLVDVTGISKGKGFAGTIKRHNFKRGRKTHGGRSYRRPGSIGSMYPQHIFKGKKMAGQMGHVQVTTRKLKVAMVDADQNLIGVVGAVPGPSKGIVLIKEAK